MNALSQGCIVAIKCWWGEHWGIVGIRDGRWTLISNRGLKGGVTEELLGSVIGSAPWRVVPLAAQLPADTVLVRARTRIGSRYDFWTWNCEDFVHWALGLKPRSPQRENMVNTLGFVGASLWLAAAKGA